MSAFKSDGVTPSVLAPGKSGISSVAAGASNTQFELTATDGGLFSLYSISVSGKSPITLTGTTSGGRTVTATLPVSVSDGFETFELGSQFSGLQSVEWNPGTSVATNIVATETVPPSSNPVPVFAPIAGGPITSALPMSINSDAGTINGVGSGGFYNGTQYFVSTANNVTTFTFYGNLVIPNTSMVTGSGSTGISLDALNDVEIGTGVQFNMSASGATAGPGGGGGGTPGNFGSVIGTGGGGGNGGDFSPQVDNHGSKGSGGFSGSDGGTGGSGAAGNPGSNGRQGFVGASGGDGINNNGGGGGGTGGSGGLGGAVVANTPFGTFALGGANAFGVNFGAVGGGGGAGGTGHGGLIAGDGGKAGGSGAAGLSAGFQWIITTDNQGNPIGLSAAVGSAGTGGDGTSGNIEYSTSPSNLVLTGGGGGGSGGGGGGGGGAGGGGQGGGGGGGGGGSGDGAPGLEGDYGGSGGSGGSGANGGSGGGGGGALRDSRQWSTYFRHKLEPGCQRRAGAPVNTGVGNVTGPGDAGNNPHDGQNGSDGSGISAPGGNGGGGGFGGSGGTGAGAPLAGRAAAAQAAPSRSTARPSMPHPRQSTPSAKSAEILKLSAPSASFSSAAIREWRSPRPSGATARSRSPEPTTSRSAKQWTSWGSRRVVTTVRK